MFGIKRMHETRDAENKTIGITKLCENLDRNAEMDNINNTLFKYKYNTNHDEPFRGPSIPVI